MLTGRLSRPGNIVGGPPLTLPLVARSIALFDAQMKTPSLQLRQRREVSDRFPMYSFPG